MTQLKVTLLGAFALATADGTPIRIETRKARALLAVLIMARGQPLQRERLAGLLWSRGETRQALASLSQAVYSLRRALQDISPGAVRTEPDTVAIHPDALATDVWEFEAAAAQDTDAGCRMCLDLYRGAFLDDLPIDTEESFSEWRTQERMRLEQLAVACGTQLMETWEATPQAAEATLVERLLSIDPYNEPAMRVRMILLARDGRPAAAIELGDAFVELLISELGIEPSERFFDIAARIRAGDYARDTGPVSATRPTRPNRRLTRSAVLAAGCIFAVAIWFLVAPRYEPTSDIVQLLVRPFDASEGISEDLAQGFSDDLSTELVRRAGLDVLSRESGRMIDATDRGAGGASHVLHGRLRAETGRWVLNAWMIEVGTGREVWAGRFTGDAEHPRTIRDEIVGRIADAVGVALLPPPDPVRIGLPDAAVPDYLRALSQLHSATVQGNAEAISQLQDLIDLHPDAIEPRAAIVLAYERVAFEAAGFARAAGLHWLEGYLRLKRELATVNEPHPAIQAARARLALRRLDHARAQALARQALESESGNIAALEVLAHSLALSGDTETARQVATRVVTLSPAAPERGYMALALASFAEGEFDAARDAVEAGIETTRTASLDLLVLRAALLGLARDQTAARAAFNTLAEAAEDRPFRAWRVGDVTFSNPRAITWRRPSAAEAARLIRFSDDAVSARLRDGLRAAAGESHANNGRGDHRALTDDEIAALLFNARIEGQENWLILQAWVQTRTADGDLFQNGAFGPLPQAREASSRIVGGRLCDSWIWEDTEIENCQLVVQGNADKRFFLAGETGMFPFHVSDSTSQPVP